MLFAYQKEMGLLILFGVLITLSNNVLSYSFHGYQTELFPAHSRPRRRLHLLAEPDQRGVCELHHRLLPADRGTKGVFGLIAVAMYRGHRDRRLGATNARP